MTPHLLLPLLLPLLLLPPTSSMECWQGREGTNHTPCEDGKQVATDLIVMGLGMAHFGLQLGAGVLMTLTNTQAVGAAVNIGAEILKRTGLDLRNPRSQAGWVRGVLDVVDFDLAKVCWVASSRRTGGTVDRGCGVAGDLEMFGANLAKWLQGEPRHLLAGAAVCFTAPLNHDQEICMCKHDGCNQSKASARSDLNIHLDAEIVQCGGEDCPLSDLSKVLDMDGGNHWNGWNTACYTKPVKKPQDEGEHCFSTEGIYDEEAVKAAREVAAGRPGYHGYTFSHQSGGVGVRSLPESGDPDKSGESGESGGLTFRISLALALSYVLLVI